MDIINDETVIKEYRNMLKDKKRIVVKIGSSSLTHKSTGGINLYKLERLVRILSDIHNQGKDVILVSSGAIAVGKRKTGLQDKNLSIAEKQACAAVGQSLLMTMYQKLFSEYNQTTAQILLTKFTMLNDLSRYNTRNTFEELLKIGVIPVVNENDTVATHEIAVGDNDCLSAIVAAITGADLLILLSDIDGLFTDDPNRNSNARFIPLVEELNDEFIRMGKETSGSGLGTGGMSAKLSAAKIATESGAAMIIANGEDLSVIEQIMSGENIGTLFVAHKSESFDIINYLSD